MKKIVIKIKWLLYKEQEKQYPILSFILDNIDDIDSIIKNILDCFLNGIYAVAFYPPHKYRSENKFGKYRSVKVSRLVNGKAFELNI